MNKWQKQQMEQITNLAVVQIPALMKSEMPAEEEYNKYRAQLNAHMIQILIGGEIAPGKDGGQEVKLNKPIPDQSVVAMVCSILNDFIVNIETPYFGAISGGDDEDDMGIPEVMFPVQVRYVEKTRNKDLRDAISGVSGAPWCFRRLTPVDCVNIAAMAKEARDHHDLVLGLIIGGSVLAVAGIASAIVIANMNKKKAEVEGIEAGDDIPDDYLDADDDPPLVSVDDGEPIDASFF